MCGRGVAGFAGLGLFLGAVPQEPPSTLLTIPQQDSIRSWSDDPSAAVSADGRSIAFVSFARLTPQDLDDHADIYVLDRVSGRVTLESVTADGRRIGANNGRPDISRDGRYLVFDATVARDGQVESIAVVIRDRWENVTKVVGPARSGAAENEWSGNAAISEDGRVVVFESTITDLLADRDQNGVRRDIYLFDVPTGVLRRVSVDNAGLQSPVGSSYSPAVSADGRYVAFTSTAELDAGPGAPGASSGGAGVKAGGTAGASDTSRRPLSQVYVRDTVLNVTRRVSVCPRGAAPDGRSWHPVISGDGRYVAFVSDATNLVSGDRNRSPDVFLYDTQAESTVVISRSAKAGTANGASSLPAISGDGRVVAFHSEASDLVCGKCRPAVEDINLLPDVFLFDRASAVMTRISHDTTGGWMEPSVAPALDAGGHVVAFTSRQPTDARDDRNDFDLFVRVPLAVPVAGSR
jgi:Tol biopolymer transport system component